MSQRIVAIVGSYRRGGTIDRLVDHVLEAAAEQGAVTDKIFLLDRHVECGDCLLCGPRRAGPAYRQRHRIDEEGDNRPWRKDRGDDDGGARCLGATPGTLAACREKSSPAGNETGTGLS